MTINLKSFIQLRKSLVIVIASHLLTVILLVSIILLSLHTSIPLEKFTRDPTATMGVNPFVGIVSNIGVLLWCVSASICLFTFFSIIKRRNNQLNEDTLFLLFFGLTTSILLLDDLFLIHEFIGPRILNIPEKQIYVFYGMIVLFGIVRFKKVILQNEWVILSLSFSFFALSVAIDIFGSLPYIPSSTFVEDSFKLLGIVSWVCYFVLASFKIEKNTVNSKSINHLL